MLQLAAVVRIKQPATEWTVNIIDISRAGVALASTEPMTAGTNFLLSFWLPGAAQPWMVEGSVVYSAATANGRFYRIGARLFGLSQQTEEQIVDFVTAPDVRR